MKLTGKEILFVKTFKDLNPIVVGTTIETFSLSNDRKCISLEVRFDDERETLFFFSKEREDEYHKSSIATIDGVRVTYDSLLYYIKAEAEKLYALNKIAYIVEITSTGTYYVSKTKNNSIPIEHIAGADDIAFDSKEEALQFMNKNKYTGKIIETTREALNDYFKARDKYNDSCKVLFNASDIRQKFDGMAKDGYKSTFDLYVENIIKAYNKDKGRILIVALTLGEAKLVANRLVSEGIETSDISISYDFKNSNFEKYKYVINV